MTMMMMEEVVGSDRGGCESMGTDRAGHVTMPKIAQDVLISRISSSLLAMFWTSRSGYGRSITA